MRLTFFETPVFTRLAPGYLDDADFRQLQEALLEAPARGDVFRDPADFGSCDGMIRGVAKANVAGFVSSITGSKAITKSGCLPSTARARSQI